MNVHISVCKVSLTLNGLFNRESVHVMLEHEDDHNICMVFPFTCALVEKAIGHGGWQVHKSEQFVLTVGF